MALKTDYKDDVLSGERKYVIVDNGDGTVSFRDVTQYTQVGDSFGALDINNTNEAVNSIQDDIGFTGTGAEIEQAMEDELVHEGEKYYETDDYDDIPWNANQVEYDHTSSGLAATSVQGAIDELSFVTKHTSLVYGASGGANDSAVAAGDGYLKINMTRYAGKQIRAFVNNNCVLNISNPPTDKASGDTYSIFVKKGSTVKCDGDGLSSWYFHYFNS